MQITNSNCNRPCNCHCKFISRHSLYFIALLHFLRIITKLHFGELTDDINQCLRSNYEIYFQMKEQSSEKYWNQNQKRWVKTCSFSTIVDVYRSFKQSGFQLSTRPICSDARNVIYSETPNFETLFKAQGVASVYSRSQIRYFKGVKKIWIYCITI